MEEAIRATDLVVTTSYHSRLVRKAAENVDVPAVTLTVNSEVVETVQRQIRSGGITLVCVDPEFGNRLRAMYADASEGPEQIRVVLADDRAARRRAGPRRRGDRDPRRAATAWARTPELPPLLLPHSPTFTAHTARELLQLIIRLNLAAAEQQDPAELLAAGV